MRQVAGASAAKARAAELREKVRWCTATRGDAGAGVTVTVLPGGVLSGLELTGEALRAGATTLASRILATVSAACADAADQLSQRMSTAGLGTWINIDELLAEAHARAAEEAEQSGPGDEKVGQGRTRPEQVGRDGGRP